MEQTNLYTMTVPPMMKTLKNLSALLDKAEAHAATKAAEKTSAQMRMEALLKDRLIFDQFELLRQVRIASDNARMGAARLAGIEWPTFEDDEQTVTDLKTRIEKTIEFVGSIRPEQIVGQEQRRVSLPYSWGKDLSAFGYATGYLMPNFYFHVVTAYSILRKNGVALVKMDYIGQMP